MDVAIVPFPADALPANRGGQLTEIQRHNLGNQELSRRKATRSFALIPLAIAAIILFIPGLKVSGIAHVGVPFVCIVVAVILFVRSSTGSDRLARDLREGKVLSLEGEVNKRGSSRVSKNYGPAAYLLDVGGKSFTVYQDTFDALPDGAYVRVYYLPRSNYVVNLERPSMDQAAAGSSSQDMYQVSNAGISSRDQTQPIDQGAFSRDILSSLGSDPFAQDPLARSDPWDTTQPLTDPIEEHFNQQSAPPVEAIPELPALARELVGSWRSPMMTVTFHSEGTAEVELRGGRKQSGHWSVDANSHLHFDVMGVEQVAEAQIAGNRLTISVGGTGLTFDRVAS
ncbi:MAG TPA: hypothetical protein VKU87_04975 [Thermomicrobiaceae bacterium]|nr:hypothetical protein [Thermomicrobiaceae bacterium]